MFGTPTAIFRVRLQKEMRDAKREASSFGNKGKRKRFGKQPEQGWPGWAP